MRFPARLLQASVLIALFTAVGAAQESYKVGQSVEVNVRGEWLKGRVVQVAPDGSEVRVRIVVNNRPQTGAVPVDQVRPEGGAAPDQPAATPAAVRTWTDSTGKFRIEAAYAGREGDAVKLRKADGSFVSIPLARLSKADQDHAATLPAAAEGKKAPAGAKLVAGAAVEVLWGSSWYPAVIRKVDVARFFIHYDDHEDTWDEWVELDHIRPRDAKMANGAGVANAIAGLPARPGGASAPAALNIETVVCELASASPIKADSKAPMPQGLAPDAGPNTALPVGAAPLRKLEVFETIEGLAPGDNAAGVVLTALVKQPPGNATTQFVRCDLKAGKADYQAPVAGAHRLLAGSGAGGWLLTVSPRNESGLVVWRLPAKDAPQPAYNLTLQTSDPSPFAKQVSRAWIQGNRAILQTEGKQLVAWNLEQRRVESCWEGYKVAVSAGGRYVAFTTDEGVGVFDLTSGKQAGFWRLGYIAVSFLEFSPQAGSLACVLQNDLKVLDLKTGKVRFDNSLPQAAGSTTNGAPCWCDENAILIGHQHLVDLNAGLVAWKYRTRSNVLGAPEMAAFGGAICYLCEGYGNTPGIIGSVVLPHPTVKTAVSAGNSANLYALGPGGAVSLQVNAGPEAAGIRAALEKRIAENGWTVAATSPVQIIVTVKQGEARTETYSGGIGGLGGDTTVTFRPSISEIDVRVNGQSAWSTATESFLPAVLLSKEGQSTQDAVRAYEKPNLDFFATLPLPRQLVRPEYRDGLGASVLTGVGIEDDAPTRAP